MYKLIELSKRHVSRNDTTRYVALLLCITTNRQHNNISRAAVTRSLKQLTCRPCPPSHLDVPMPKRHRDSELGCFDYPKHASQLIHMFVRLSGCRADDYDGFMWSNKWNFRFVSKRIPLQPLLCSLFPGNALQAAPH